MPGLVLQHGEHGPPARLGEWLQERGVEHRVHRSWEDAAPTDPRDFSFVASLGSAHSVNAAEPAWIPRELEFLRGAVSAGVPVLGLCWGGQALSLALGGQVGPSAMPEVGWLEIDSADPAIAAGPWLHYHYDVFTVPREATEVGRSPAGPAAFRLGPHLGLQFHPEATAELGESWGRQDRGLVVSSVEVLAEEGARFGAPARELAFSLFDHWYADSVTPGR